ncbi:hypothetical protein ABZ916_39275 [Streptomyces sp. NPDC046853]|uniref:hypothetical protein n=1 Tax=Streptomyces sp. NPDC046853 TaxID=3154920 RepID=UPI0033D15D2B
MGLFGSKSDKECAQIATAVAMATERTPHLTEDVMKRELTLDEMKRGQAYLLSGKKVTGRA